MRRSLLAFLFLLTLCSSLVVALAEKEPVEPPKQRVSSRVLPGAQANGTIQLHNQWLLRPAGKQLSLGDFPVNIALHPSGKWLAVMHSGFGEHEVIVVDLNSTKQKIACRVPIDQGFYGLCFSPDGTRLFASGGEYEVVHAFDFAEGLLGKKRSLRVAKLTDKFVPGGLAVHPSGETLYVAGTWGHGVCILPVSDPESREVIVLENDSYPYTCALDSEARRLFVSLWNKASVAVIDLATKQVSGTWETERHPTEMVLSPDGKTLYVACANSTRVSVLDTASGKPLQTLSCSLYPAAPVGNTPMSLSLTPEGQMLFVANADCNNLAVFNVAEPANARSLGFIPVGWYPTSVRFNPHDKKIYVANGRGTTTLANPQGPNPLLPPNRTVREYIAGLYRGTLAAIDTPTPEKMGEYTRQAFACSPLRQDQGVTGDVPDDSPIPRRLKAPCPITHVVYVIKENRTYDQILGDMKEGNGDPSICIFPEKVTPNHHKLAREFVLLDNFYADGEVSANGHEWSMGAYASDFVEKVWPLVYRGSPNKKFTQYPAEGSSGGVGYTPNGYIWDRCKEAGVTYRSYGEFIQQGKNPADPPRARVKSLEGHFDEKFHGYDLDYSDQGRVDRFLEELARFEKEDAMPQFIVMRLPSDHTHATVPGKPTPTAMVADNDLGLGRLIEGLSHSKFWKETAVFVVEDDAQNGSDHVDAHRTVAFVVSPYARRGSVDSTLYSTTSMLRTMELILGLEPMSQFDAAARPMYASFRNSADARPYEHVKPGVDMTEKNPKNAPGAEVSKTFDFSKEDLADDFAFNEVIWKSVRGATSRMPAPVHAAYVFPKPKRDDDDD
jgi:DNA-binding beta-propeller fold protein YncE